MTYCQSSWEIFTISQYSPHSVYTMLYSPITQGLGLFCPTWTRIAAPRPFLKTCVNVWSMSVHCTLPIPKIIFVIQWSRWSCNIYVELRHLCKGYKDGPKHHGQLLLLFTAISSPVCSTSTDYVIYLGRSNESGWTCRIPSRSQRKEYRTP